MKVTPAYSFGHGLSFSTFEYASLRVYGDYGNPKTVSATITNTGAQSGQEIAQIYIEFPSSADSPPLQLKGFIKSKLLAPGESASLRFPLTDRSLSVWDVGAHAWKKVEGTYKVSVGASLSDLRMTVSFDVRD